jgi:hypothetical protein
VRFPICLSPLTTAVRHGRRTAYLPIIFILCYFFFYFIDYGNAYALGAASAAPLQ